MRYCVFGCQDLEAYGISVYQFPNPVKKPDLFQRWVSVVGFFHLKESDPKKIFKSKKVCGRHFVPSDITDAKRLKPLTVPSVKLYQAQQSNNTKLAKEHNFSFARQASNILCNSDETKQPAVPEDWKTVAANIKEEKPDDENDVVPDENPAITNNIEFEKAASNSEAVPEECPTIAANIKEEKPDDENEAIPDDCPTNATNIKEEKPNVEDDAVQEEGPTIAANIKEEKPDDENEAIPDDCPTNATNIKEEKPNVEDDVVPEDNPAITNNIKVEKQASGSEAVTEDCTTVAANINGEKPDGENYETEDYYETITEGDLLFSGYNDFLVSLVPDEATKQRRNSETPRNYSIINTGINTNVTTSEETITIKKEPKDDVDTIAEPDKSFDATEDFFRVTPTLKTYLRKPKRTANKVHTEENKTPPKLTSIKKCDNCKTKIEGFQYKCLHCNDYNHCFNCELHEAHPDHYMIRMPKTPELLIPDAVIDKMCDEFRLVINILKGSEIQEKITEDEPVNNKSKVHDTSWISKVMTRVIKDKAIGKRKRKKIMPDDKSKKRKMAVKKTEINVKTPAEVKKGQNDPLPNLKYKNKSIDHDKEKNYESMTTIATVLTDNAFPEAVHMALASNVSKLIIELVKEGERVIYKYVGSDSELLRTSHSLAKFSKAV